MNDLPRRENYPPMLRLILRIGRPFGLHFVPEYHLQVIDHMGEYGGAKGPGLMLYNPMTETLGPLVFIGGQIRERVYTGLLSRDVLPVSVRLHTVIGYDPRIAPALAPILTRLSREVYPGIADMYLRWALLAEVGQYNATELTRREVTAQVENQVHTRVASEMKFLGIQPRDKVHILQVDLPQTLTDRHETIAQRRAGILAGAEYHPAEVRRALVTEVLENLGRGGAGESFVNFSELIESYAAEHPPRPPAQPTIDNPPQSTLRSDSAKPSPRPKSRL